MMLQPNHYNMMTTKAKKTVTTVAAATRLPKKSVPPLRIAGRTRQDIAEHPIQYLLVGKTSKELAALLRERAIPIPKDKTEMVIRLAAWIRRPEATFTLTLG